MYETTVPRAISASRRLSSTAALASAIALALFAFFFSFNQLGGTLGGFKNDEFATLVHTNMVLSGLQPLRDFEEAGLRAVWPSLTYEVEAAAERTWGRNLFVHACLTLGVLAVCRVLLFLIARGLGGWLMAALAALLAFVSLPEPYNYPKVLVLTVAALLIVWTVRKPTLPRLALLGAWAVVSVLFRNDFGVYVGTGIVAAILALGIRPWIVPARRLAIVSVVGLVLFTPSLIWIHQYRGIGQFVREANESSGAEYETRRLKEWPVVDAADPTSRNSLVAICYYCFWAIPFAAIPVAVASGRRGTVAPPPLAIGCALIAMSLVVNHFFLRSNVGARFGDAAVPVGLVAAWTAGMSGSFSTARIRRLLLVAPAAVLAVLCVMFVSINDIPRRLRDTGLLDSPRAVASKFSQARRDLRSEPPTGWHDSPTRGHMAVSRYLFWCLKPEQFVLVGMYADDVVAYSRRRYAGGQAYFDGSFFQSERDQRRALGRLAHQVAPIAITTEYQDEFQSDFPLIAQHLYERYRRVGTVESSDEQPPIVVWADRTVTPTGVDDILGLPCFR